MIERVLEKTVKSKLHTGKAIVLLGARQVGKTTLLKTLFGTSEEVLWLNGDEMDVQAIFAAISATRLKAIFGNKKIIVIDEASMLPNKQQKEIEDRWKELQPPFQLDPLQFYVDTDMPVYESPTQYIARKSTTNVADITGYAAIQSYFDNQLSLT